MAFSVVQSRAIAALTLLPVSVETDLSNGLPQFSIVGLPDAAVREAKERVRSAIINSGFEFPQRRITVNLAPADLPKDSGRFDLAIAIGILIASGQISSARLSATLGELIFVGELSLTGQLLPIRGAFAMAVGFLREQTSQHRLILPLQNQVEASLTDSDRLCFAASLAQVVDHLKTATSLAGLQPQGQHRRSQRSQESWSDVRGQHAAKRAALIAAAGQHNLLMLGPPGIGKSMIASRMATLLPDLSHAQACELAAVQSLSGSIDLASWQRPPYRAPHHSASSRALIGGGQPVRPGEISLAHHGVLFLDEFPEFARDALESLREPLEKSEVSIARVRDRVTFPADIMLIAAMNPCPCGYFGVRHPKRHCRCTPDRIARYRNRISGPLMDRFDMVIGLEAPSADELLHPLTEITQDQAADGQDDATIKASVDKARHRQQRRQSCLNARLSIAEIQRHAPLDVQAEQLMSQAARHWGWSARSWHRVLRVSRTIADLADAVDVGLTHVAEAIELRRAIDLGAQDGAT
jgi:magnesium chelatase family protein